MNTDHLDKVLYKIKLQLTHHDHQLSHMDTLEERQTKLLTFMNEVKLNRESASLFAGVPSGGKALLKAPADGPPPLRKVSSTMSPIKPPGNRNRLSSSSGNTEILDEFEDTRKEVRL